MERLTRRAEAEREEQIYKKRLAQGYWPNKAEERYFMLAKFENILEDNNITLDQLQELVEKQQKCLLVELPCDPSKPVYRIAKCKDIPHQLDGTMYSSDGSPGTATGYYCPYEDNCPHDADDCDNYKNIPNVFEDSVEEVKISCWYDERLMLLENTGVVDFNDFGKTVFLTKEDATAAIEASHET